MDTKQAVSILVQLVESHQITVRGQELAIAAQALALAKEFAQSPAGEPEPSADNAKQPS